MEEILKKIYYEDSADFFISIYESSESDGRILKEVKKDTDPRNKLREDLNMKIKFACKSDEILYAELQKCLDEYKQALEDENVFYTKRYYKQRNERCYKIVNRFVLWKKIKGFLFLKTLYNNKMN